MLEKSPSCLLTAMTLIIATVSQAQVPALSFTDPSTTGIPGEAISEVSVAGDGRIWMGVAGGLTRFDAAANSIILSSAPTAMSG